MKWLLRSLFILVPLLLLTPRYLQYRKAIGVVPPGVTLAGQAFPNTATAPEIEATLKRIYAEPLVAYYGDERAILRPSSIRYEVDVPGMLAQAQAHGQGWAHGLNFARSLLEMPPLAVDVPAKVTYNPAAFETWLVDVAQKADKDPVSATFDADALSFGRGTPGQHLDVEAAQQLVLSVLARTDTRELTLPVSAIPAPKASLDVLRALLSAKTEGFPGVVSIFVRDLETGEETSINAGIPFSAIGTMKMPIVVDALYQAQGNLDDDTLRTFTETVHLGGNASANLLLERIGAGDRLAGARDVTAQLQLLGLSDSYMAQPYDSATHPAPISTPANQHPAFNTQPDPAMQTTARDMGVLLGMISDCAAGKGNLLAALADHLTVGKCQSMLGWFEQNDYDVLLQQGLPQGTRYARKHSFSADTHADVMTFWGGSGRYVLAVFLYQKTWLELDRSSALSKTIAQGTWNFFQFRGG